MLYWRGGGRRRGKGSALHLSTKSGTFRKASSRDGGYRFKWKITITHAAIILVCTNHYKYLNLILIYLARTKCIDSNRTAFMSTQRFTVYITKMNLN